MSDKREQHQQASKGREVGNGSGCHVQRGVIVSEEVDFSKAIGSKTRKLPAHVRQGRVPTRSQIPASSDRSTLEDQSQPGRDSLLLPAAPLSARRKKRGKIEHSLDLHGETAADCVALLKQFFDRAVLCSYDSVLVIHGKGLHSGGQAILRNVTLNWLRHHTVNYGIKDMYHPKRHLGGNGATVVVFR